MYIGRRRRRLGSVEEEDKNERVSRLVHFEEGYSSSSAHT
jgi:hypothetical protein